MSEDVCSACGLGWGDHRELFVELMEEEDDESLVAPPADEPSLTLAESVMLVKEELERRCKARLEYE